MTALDNFLGQLDATPQAVQDYKRQPKRLDKIVIGWLYQPLMGVGMVQQGMFEALWRFVKHDRVEREVLEDLIAVQTPYIPQGRNDLCRKFLATDADWLLMVDWDISFTPQDVYRLLDDADPIGRPVIGGCYVTFLGHDGKLRPCWMVQEGSIEFAVVNHCDVDEIIPCTSIGMGFTLIHRNVLDAVAAANKHDPWLWFGQDNIAGAHIGEDMTFCSRARRLGFGVWGHGGVQIGHTKTKVWHVSDLENKEI